MLLQSLACYYSLHKFINFRSGWWATSFIEEHFFGNKDQKSWRSPKNSRAYCNPICLKNQEERKIRAGLEPRLSTDLKSLQWLREREGEPIVVGSVTCVAVSVDGMTDQFTRVLQGREMDGNLSIAAVRNFNFTKLKTVSFCKAFLLTFWHRNYFFLF